MIDQAISINENLAVAWANRGGIGVLLGQHDAAIEQLQRSLRLRPLDPEAYWAETTIAIARTCQGNNSAAIIWTTKALARRPDYMVAFWVSAVAHAFSGKLDDARACIERMRDLNPAMRMSNLRAFIPLRRPQDVEKTIEGTRLAGLPE
jgi:tetratricopeptide (TPR) repeat protein